MKAVSINGNEILITVNRFYGNFGTVYVASNNYGEPKLTIRGFRSKAEAVENEISELRQMLQD